MTLKSRASVQCLPDELPDPALSFNVLIGISLFPELEHFFICLLGFLLRTLSVLMFCPFLDILPCRGGGGVGFLHIF